MSYSFLQSILDICNTKDFIQMKHRLYQVDAFTDKVFSGNPAAVCPLDKWLSDDLMQKIARENNLPETAFFVKERDHYLLRWFTPTIEVDLCGHATLASAYILFNHEHHAGDTIRFHTGKSGILTVTQKGEMLTLNFPSDEILLTDAPVDLKNGFNIQPAKVFKGRSDYLFIYNNEDEIANLEPNYDVIAKWKARGVIVTARGNKVDFVSRFFAPQVGVDEDPVTGSAHTTLTTYWSKELGKTAMTAMQLSLRKGYLQCRYLNDRVEISGQCRLYMIGEIYTD